jgi:CBS domain containing-hemolysin-like protein
MPLLQARPPRTTLWVASVLAGIFACASADASMFAGETMDKVANGIAWVVLVLVPVVGITVFWLVHILPEKVAEKKRHPQAKAIQVLCLLSLVFGGLLWPLAWLWAYSKPVMYKMAYGTDVSDEHHGEAADAATTVSSPEAARAEIEQLRARLATLEAQASREARG